MKPVVIEGHLKLVLFQWGVIIAATWAVGRHGTVCQRNVWTGAQLVETKIATNATGSGTTHAHIRRLHFYHPLIIIGTFSFSGYAQ